MRYLTIIFCAVLVLFSLSVSQARIIHVPADSSTIQGGINGAVNGDTVLVAPGTYYEHINFNGKAILVTSEAGVETTTINKLYDGLPIVTFNSGEGNTSILDGFTIQNARNLSGNGGGIHCGTGSPTLRNNIISGNRAIFGGGIYCINNSSPLIHDNQIIGNTAEKGGAIFCVRVCSPYITYNRILYNSADSWAGAIYCEHDGSPTISYNLLIGNHAPDCSGILISHGIVAQILNNTLDRNQSQTGAIRFWSPSPQAVMTNTIISNELSGYGVYVPGGSSINITYSDLWNNESGNYYGCAPGVGCISADPFFCDPENSNYYLHYLSPCHGAGEGGVDMGAFGVVGCGWVWVAPGPDIAGPANTEVSVFFSVQNGLDSTDTFDLEVSDQLGWSIEPMFYQIVLNPSQIDTVHFTVSIPYAPIGTEDSIRLDAISRSDSTVRHHAYLTVTCNSFLEGVEVTPGSDQSGYPDSLVLVAFLVQNVGVVTDSYSLDISDTEGWDIVPLHYDLVLNTGEIDTINCTVSIPYVALGTADQVTLLAQSKTNPLVSDAASLTVTCNAYLEGWEITSGDDISAPVNSLVTAKFYVQNTGLAPDSCSLTISDSLGWDIQPLSYLLTLNPGQEDSVSFDVFIPYDPVGTTDRITLSGISLTNPFVVDSASLLITCASRIIHVPADFSTIQAAIDFSSDWDSILVAPDTYHEHIFFKGKGVVVKSEKGRDSTIISKIAGGVSMVSFISGEGSNSVLDGFTITGGNLESGKGAGIRCQNSSPTIVNNRIVNNSSPYGAGIDCDDYSSPLIAYNIIEENTATSQGGGIRCANHSSPVILENVITANSAANGGAGICCLANCSPTITANLIVDNAAQTGYGGGIALFNSSTVNITNNTIDKNRAPRGGGIYIENTTSAMIVNTIVTNSLSGKGIRNEGSFPTIIYCDVWNNLDENYYGCIPGQGCISADPIFCNPDNGDYYLWITSPCIGAGQDSADMGALGVGCEVVGDANADGVVNSADVVYLINYLFKFGPSPHPWQAGDTTCDGVINSADVVYLINYLYKGGPAPSC